MSSHIGLWLTLSVVYGLAVGYRLQILDLIVVGSDTLSPIWAAIGVLHHGWADPPNPESDHWLWVTHLPLMLGTSLRDVFWLRCCQAALIAPMGAYAAWVLSSRNVWAALSVGMILALDPGLRDTLIVGFRGYGAPEWFMLSFLGAIFALQGKRWGGILCGAAWVIAAGQHSLTLGAILAVLYLGYTLKNKPKEQLILALTILLCFIPRGLWVWEILQCDEGGFQCVVNIASGSSEADKSYFELLFRGIRDRFHVEWSWGALVGLLGLYWVKDRRLSVIALLGGIGILVLALSIYTLRPYHFRIFVGPLVVLGGVGWWRKYQHWGGVISAVWVAMMLWGQMAPIGQRHDLKIHDEIGHLMHDIKSKVWIESVFLEEDSPLDPSAVVASAYLQGWNTQYLACSPKEATVFWGLNRKNDTWVIHDSTNKEGLYDKIKQKKVKFQTLSVYDAAVQICDNIELE